MDTVSPRSSPELPCSPKSTKYALSSSEVKQDPVACIFCLTDLLRGDPIEGSDGDVARLSSCNHTMHNECLQPWLERANSCPLCRTNFHEVSVSKTLDSEIFQTYRVEDKLQVADEIQPDLDLLLLQEQEELDVNNRETFRGECNQCLGGEDLRSTVLCGLCARFFHVECLEPRRPANVLICRHCATQERRAVMSTNVPSRGNARTTLSSRFSRTGLVTREQLAWESAWERLEADHSPWDIHDDDDDGEENEVPIISVRSRANRRRAVAAAQTGGMSTFVEPAAWTEPVRRARTAWPQQPPVINEEEKELWETFEMALKECQDTSTQGGQALRGDGCPGPSRKRARESSADPNQTLEDESEEWVERKRPRTRRDSQLVCSNNGEASKSVAAQTPTNRRPTVVTLPESEDAESSTEPQSAYSRIMSHIGKGVEYPSTLHGTGGFTDGGRTGVMPLVLPSASNPRSRLDSPDTATSSFPFAVGSPPLSRPHSPIEETPVRRDSTKSSSPIRRTPAASPVQSVLFRPWERHSRLSLSSNRRPYQAPSPPSGSDSSGSEDQQNFDKRKSVNNLTPKAKEDLASMVKSILKPMYPARISKQEFTEINKNVSRQLYSLFNSEDVGLDDKEKWKRVAEEHVSIALRNL